MWWNQSSNLSDITLHRLFFPFAILLLRISLHSVLAIWHFGSLFIHFKQKESSMSSVNSLFLKTIAHNWAEDKSHWSLGARHLLVLTFLTKPTDQTLTSLWFVIMFTRTTLIIHYIQRIRYVQDLCRVLGIQRWKRWAPWQLCQRQRQVWFNSFIVNLCWLWVINGLVF